MRRRTSQTSSGLTLLELMFVIALLGTLTAIAVPVTNEALDYMRAAAAARYVSARVMDARMEAVKRSTAVALRFEPGPADYAFTTYVDGNGNGVRTLDIRRGIDTPLTRPERLHDNFRGVQFGLMAGVPDVDGGRSSPEGVRIGASRILTLTPNGTATSGTLYIRGRRGQFAVRVLGVTGRTRVLQYDTGGRTWITR
jgi:prepilin-type N-terminal cleavage/methylation domain-containing protein